MALTQKLLIRQSQALVMTPQLMQAIKLLQLSNLDLVAYVENELERNPLLERSEGDGAPAPGETGPEPEAAPAVPAEAQAGDWAGEELQTSRSAIEGGLDTSLENVFPDDGPPAPEPARPAEPAAYSEWAGVGAGGRESGDYNLEAFVSAEITLASHLADQLLLAIHDPARRMIG